MGDRDVPGSDAVGLRAALIILATGLLMTACATIDVPEPEAAPRGPHVVSFMESGDPTPAPSGFDAMCRRSTAVCLGALFPGQSLMINVSGQTKPVALTPEALALLQTINDDVNTRIHSVTDKVAHGVEELWIDPLAPRLMDHTFTAPGDCEDFAIAKRDALRASGWPADAMFLAVGYHRRAGLHVALVVHTTQGDLVLDSRSPWIKGWNDTPYIWTKRQVSGNSMAWVKPYATTPELRLLTAAIEARAKGGTAAR